MTNPRIYLMHCCPENEIQARWRKVLTALGLARQARARCKNRASTIQARRRMKPSLMRKLLHFTQQLSFFRDEENAILDEIDAIERRHRYLRRKKKLRSIKPSIAKAFRRRKEKDARKENDPWWLVLLSMVLLDESARTNAPAKTTKPQPR